MQIQVNTDHTIEGHEALAARIRGVVENALSRMSDHITRVEVHLIDESGPKSRKNNKRCMMEARLEGRQPIVSSTKLRLWTWPSMAPQIN